MRYYLPKREKYWYVLVISIALSSLWLLVMRVALWALFKNDSLYMHSLAQSTYIRYAIAFLMIGCCTVLSLLWYSQLDRQAVGPEFDLKRQTSPPFTTDRDARWRHVRPVRFRRFSMSHRIFPSSCGCVGPPAALDDSAPISPIRIRVSHPRSRGIVGGSLSVSQ